VDWQQLIALSIVGFTVLSFIWRLTRKKNINDQMECDCQGESEKSSILITGRKGENPKIIVKMK